MNRNQTLFYFVLSAVNIIAGIIENVWIGYITKPLLMLTLAFFYFQYSQKTLNNRDKIVLGALLFSCLGDTFLMFQGANPNFFLFGLGAFLLAQVCYVVLFQREGKPNYLRWIPFVLYSSLLLFILLNKITSDLRIPIIVYSLVITMMGIRSSERQVSQKSYQLVLVGAVLFIISDSLIALSKFVASFPLAGVWIMLTYVIAQYLIIKGLMLSRRS